MTRNARSGDLVQYQLTELGHMRYQTGKLPAGIGVPERMILQDLAEYGGIANVAELKSKIGSNPQTVPIVLGNLVKVGLVVEVDPSMVAPIRK